MTLEDKELIVQAIQGDPDAINQVAVRYGEFANRVAWKIVRNSADAADITQEVLLKLVSSLHSVETVESFQGWLYRITYRVSLNWLRSRSKRLRHEVPMLDEEAGGTDEVACEADASSRKEEQLRRMAQAAESLPYPYLVIVKMFYFEERSCHEIAGILGISEGTAKVQLHRARAMIREKFESPSET